MKWSFAAIGVFLLGVIGVSIIFLFQAVTTNNESDYYLLKEVTEAAMIEAIDLPYYRQTGNLKIVKEKFIENFTRRFAESTIFLSSEYTITSYDIMEMPPKVSIVIDTGIGEFTVGGNTADYAVKNKLDAILEYVGVGTYQSPTVVSNPYVPKTIDKEYYAIPTLSDLSSGVSYSLKLPSELVAPNIKNVKIVGFDVDVADRNQGTLGMALLQNELSYYNVTTNYMQFIDRYATIISLSNKEYYNCQPTSNPGYNCDGDNKYYVKFKGNTSETGKSNAIIKYKVTWSYDEYEFS